MTIKNDELLREAIADAKTIREAAIANARIAIEDHFKPHISNMLSKKLRAEMNDPKVADGHGSEEGGETLTEPVMEDTAPVDSSAIGTGDNKQPSKDASDSTEFGTGSESDRVEDLSEELDEPKAADGHGSAEGGESMKEPVLENEFGFGNEGIDELDLSSVIRELEADIEDDEMSDDEFDFDVDPTAAVDPSAEFGADAGLDGIEGPGADVAALGAPDAGAEIDGLGLDLDEPEGEPGEDDEIDLEEMLREMEAEDTAMDAQHFASVAESEKLHSENASLKRDLKEHRQVISFLREKLQEVNLLNSKLLYTNKLFKSLNFDLAGKQRVVEQFDRATTVREVKLVYATLAEGFKTPGKKSASKITEGFASRATGGNTAAKSEDAKKVLTEGANTNAGDDAFRARMKKLANIR